MTNPDDIVRVRARLEGRASVYEANGWAQAYTTGLLSGNGVLPNTVPDMNVLVGGSQDNPDVVIAQNANGYKIALDIVGQQAITITAPASQSRISAIVAYTDDLSLASTDSTTTGSPSSCGLIVVNGNTASTPTEPSEATIRSAITADGATGSQACYCVIATILVSSSTTTISTSLITPKTAMLSGSGVVSATNIDFATLKKTLWTNPNSLSNNFSPQDITVSDSFANYDYCVIYWKHATTDDSMEGTIFRPDQGIGIRLCYGNGSTNRVGSRDFNYVSTTKLSTGHASYNGAENDSAVIPWKIVGYKL